MRISTKGRYALRLMLDLAEHRDEGYIALKDVAARQGISKNYLDQIMILLNHARFFKTTRGYQGGYMLAKEPAAITVGDILRATEGSLAPVGCLDDCGDDCERSAECAARQVWAGLETVMNDYLDHLTLKDILTPKGGKRKRPAKRTQKK